MSTQGNGTNGNGHHVDKSVSAESESGASIFHAAPPPGQLTKKDFVSNQEVRWCPGCGDYAILNNVQKVMPEASLRLINTSSVTTLRPFISLDAKAGCGKTTGFGLRSPG